MLKIYNSLSGQKEALKPIVPGKIRMYVCGMTVYDFCHIGHARVMVVFDMISRYLKSRGLEVLYVRNITDIDDKIIDRARRNHESVAALTERFIKEMNRDAAALGVLPPDLEPRASRHIAEIIAMITALIKRGHAYLGANKDVYFDVGSFKDYGRLSGKNTAELRAGERVKAREEKHDPLDFALWKAAREGEPSWPSPWGEGRPGWHIECSAMATHCLGNHFDIHGGGQDLQFPHHENEIAQSVCATGEAFANLWAHNGFVRVDEEKMSKSLGNFFTVREVLQSYRPEAARFFILASHYRSPLNYSNDNLDEAQAALGRLYTALRDCGGGNSAELIGDYVAAFHACMEDDFNTPKAIALLHKIARRLNRTADKSSREARSLAATLRRLGAVLGLLQAEPRAFLQGRADQADSDAEMIERLIQARAEAKTARAYQEADAIRDQLAALGVSLEDTPRGTIWRRN